MDRNGRQIQAGWNVYGRDDEKVGEISEVGPNYLLVRKGWLFTRDIYIPLSAVADVQPDQVVLNVRKDEIDQLGWDVIPPDDVRLSTYSTTTADAMDTSSVTSTASVDTGVETYRRTDDAATATRTSDVDTGEEIRIPVVEEEVRVGKRVVEAGGVQVTKRVEERPVNEQVTLREEHVHVERRPVDRPVADADLAAVRDGTIEVREHSEEAVVDKQARIVEEVVVGKDVHEHTETVQDTVRRTDVHIEEIPGQTRTSGYTETTSTGFGERAGAGTAAGTYGTDAAATGSDEGTIERGLSRAGNAAERATGLDLDRDRDVGQRDPRNNY